MLRTKISLVIASFFCLGANAFGAITIDVRPSSAPNAYGSPSWAGYVANALHALENDLSVYGDRSTNPTGYEVLGPAVEPGDFMVTSFHSWRGVANPTGAFADEHGNRLHFGMHAYGDGTEQFKLEDLTFELHSNDPGDLLAFSGDFIGYSYNERTIGIDWGADNQKGGGDDTVYDSGNGTALVDEIIYVGAGNAFWPGGGDPNPANPAGGQQEAIDDTVAWIESSYPFAITTTYTIDNYSGSATVTTVPEPGALAVWGVLGGLGLIVMQRRRRHV